METITVSVTAGDKALVLARELGLVTESLKILKEHFPKRADCEVIEEAGKTCRDLQTSPENMCPRCQYTDELAKDWRDLKQRKYRLIKRLASLGMNRQPESPLRFFNRPFGHSLKDSDPFAKSGNVTANLNDYEGEIF